MLEKTRKHLLFLFTTTIAGILTFFLIISFLFIRQQIKAQDNTNLNNSLSQIKYKIQMEQNITVDWLSTVSNEYKILVYIEDNGSSLLPDSHILNSEHKKSIIQTLKSLALNDSLNTDICPIFYQQQESPLYSFYVGQCHYIGCVASYTTNNGWCNVFIASSAISQDRKIAFMMFLFLSLDLIGTGILFFFCRYYIKKTLLPVKESQRKEKRFIASASHELRSPLAVIQATVDLMQLNPDTSDSESLAVIAEETGQMSQLIEDLLTLASAQSESWSISKTTIDMETLLFDLYDNYLTLPQNEPVELLLDLPDYQLPSILADRHRIKQVLSILINNALRYSCSGSTITLSAKSTSSYLLLSVIDHGAGIPDTEKEKIFEPFYQRDVAHTQKSNYGLGLSIAKEIIQLHKGLLTVSDTPGGGATFTIKLLL